MEPTEHNRRAWDEVHRRRAQILSGRLGLPPQVRRALADLKGKKVLHLQCGTGKSTAELAELGATVTGVDGSEEALDLGRERWPSILWVQGDVQALPRELRRERFDLVYAASGVLPWLHDLAAWAAGVAGALRLGGDFLLFEEHPAALCVDGMMRWRESYFDESAEADRLWRLGQVVTTLVRAGLAIQALEEYPAQPGNYRRLDARVPGEFLLYARKAA